MTEAIIITLAAIWRRLKGMQGVHGTHLLVLPLIMVALYDSGLSYGVQAWVIFITTINVLKGFQDWNDWSYMLIRYSGIAAIAMLPVATESAYWYVFACALAGGFHSLVAANAYLFPNKNRFFDGFTVYAELVAGAVVVGGLCFVQGS